MLAETCYIQRFDMQFLKYWILTTCASLKDMGMGTGTTLIKEDRKAVNNMSISPAYCLMSVIPISFRSLGVG